MVGMTGLVFLVGLIVTGAISVTRALRAAALIIRSAFGTQRLATIRARLRTGNAAGHAVVAAVIACFIVQRLVKLVSVFVVDIFAAKTLDVGQRIEHFLRGVGDRG